MGKAKIIVCTHKPGFVLDNDLFMPLQVGKAVSGTDLGFLGDDTGDNISLKNPNYCELTGMYWAWKNLRDVDYVGLVHYRRYFKFKDIKLSHGTLQSLQHVHVNPLRDLKGYDVILPIPRRMDTSVGDTYIYAHVMEDFRIMNSVILARCPDYRETMIEFFFRSNKWIAYNMFFASWKWFDQYCQWLFPILFEVEKQVKLSGYAYQQRVFGFMSELLLPLYCFHNRYRIRYRPVLFVADDSRFANMMDLRMWLLGVRDSLKFGIMRPKRKNIRLV